MECALTKRIITVHSGPNGQEGEIKTLESLMKMKITLAVNLFFLKMPSILQDSHSWV